jgi:hypothetical protein
MWRRCRVPLEDFSRDFATHLRARVGGRRESTEAEEQPGKQSLEHLFSTR